MQNKANLRLKKFKKILWEKWDPIGVNDIVTAADEYDSYAIELCKMSFGNEFTQDKVIEYLNHVETDWMGQEPANFERNKNVSILLMEAITV